MEVKMRCSAGLRAVFTTVMIIFLMGRMTDVHCHHDNGVSVIDAKVRTATPYVTVWMRCGGTKRTVMQYLVLRALSYESGHYCSTHV